MVKVPQSDFLFCFVWSTPILAYSDEKVKKNHSTFFAQKNILGVFHKHPGIYYFVNSATLYANGLRVSKPSHKNTFISAAPSGTDSNKCV